MLAVLHQFRATERLPLPDLEHLQFRQLEQLLSHASRAVPYYGPGLKAAGFVPGQQLTAELWQRLPVLTRLRQDFGVASTAELQLRNPYGD